MNYVLLAPLLVALACSSCSTSMVSVKNSLGVEEFIMDSYKIKEGKFSIMAMEDTLQVEPVDEAMMEPFTETITNGDRLAIHVSHPDRADIASLVEKINNSIGYEVVEGFVNLPDLAPIHVEGLSISQAKQVILKAYHQELQGVQVFLSITDSTPRCVELIGLTSVSSVNIDGTTRLFEVLSKAKIPTGVNYFKSYLVREGKMLHIDFYKLVTQGDMSQNIVMHAGDKIFIADGSASSMMVLGEVNRPRIIDLPTGSMPLVKALAMAGGIPFTGNTEYIQVVRGNISSPKVYTLSWDHIVQLPERSMLLMPGDIVLVAAMPITQWNRFFLQVFPTISGVELLRKGVGGFVAVE